MKNTKALISLYTVAILFALWPGGGVILSIAAGVVAIGAIVVTTDAIREISNDSQTARTQQKKLTEQLQELNEKIEFMQRDTAAALTTARVEELAERMALFETEIAAQQSEKKEATPSAYAGWPRGGTSEKKVSVKKRKLNGTNYTVVPIDDTFLEISDILYPVDGSDKIYCSECYRAKKKTTEVYLREDGAAYICDKCDTWIPTDAQDTATRIKTIQETLAALKTKPKAKAKK